jgi:hypothetical protein
VPARPSATADPSATAGRRLTALVAPTVLAVLGLALTACGGPATPHISQPDAQPEAGTNDPGSPEPGTPTPSPGESPGPANPSPANPSPAATNPANPGAPRPAGSAQPSNVPAALVGTWSATVAGAPMTKVLRPDATYSETWADPAAPCQASGTLQVNGGTLTLNPSTTNCTWRVVVFQFAVDGNALVLTSGGLDQDYTRT